MSFTARFITKVTLALLASPLAAASGWLAGAVAKYGLHLTPGEVKSFGELGIGAAVVLALKVIHDVEVKHPKLVADIKDVAVSVEQAFGVAKENETPDSTPAVSGWPEG